MSRFDPQPIRAAEMRAPGAGMTLNDSVYDRLLRERIIFLGQPVDDNIANQICAQLLLLSAENGTRDINLYINSPGGSVTAGMAIYDTMKFIECDVATYALGLAEEDDALAQQPVVDRVVEGHSRAWRPQVGQGADRLRGVHGAHGSPVGCAEHLTRP